MNLSEKILFLENVQASFVYLIENIFDADVTVKNLNPIIKTVMAYLIATIKELVFVWCVKL